MEIAALNKRVTFQKYGLLIDQYGNHTCKWQDVFTMFCTIGDESGSEISDAGVVIDKPTFSITARWCTGTRSVKPKTHRIMMDGIAYDITAVDSLNQKHRAIKFICKKEGIGDESNSNN